MSIQLVSLSYKLAPIAVREKFGFSLKQQEEIMMHLTQDELIEECVLLVTCNRTELYVYSKGKTQEVFRVMKQALLMAAKQEENDEITKYIWRYQEGKAVHHLFQVTSGLDSMVIGEDQILGQVKQAHETARKLGVCKTYLNTLFRDAVTGAKRVKTETSLSKTPVSTASLAIKAAEETLGSLVHKKIMIIGASGKIGSIVLKNLQTVPGIEIYVTVRNRSVSKKIHSDPAFKTIEYDNRYSYMKEMDVIVSATTSPHYTVLYCHMKAGCSNKEKVFLDLAVPTDIESKIGTIDGYTYYNIDDFKRIAARNNEKKQMEAETAEVILESYETQFNRWLVFQEALPIMRETKQHFLSCAEEKSPEKALQQMFYDIREKSSPEELSYFFKVFSHYLKK